MPEQARHDGGRKGRPLRREVRGVAVTEFALILPALLTLVLGGIEAGHILYMRNVLQGELERAARAGSLEDVAGREGAIDAYLAGVVRRVAPGATFGFTRRAYRSYADAHGRAEPFEDGNANDACDNNETFTDLNGNGQWDRDSGVDGPGGARAITVYEVHVTFPPLVTPYAAELLGRGPYTLTTSTELRNQPYAPGEPPPTGQCP